MTRPDPLTVHHYAIRLIRALEDAEPGKPIGVYFAQAQRYVRDRQDADDGEPFWGHVLRHLKAGCPAPTLYSPTTLPAMCGGLTLHA